MAQKDLKVRHFQSAPSPAEFATVEDANVPAVIRGCVTSWPAFQRWNPSNGGFERLKHLAGPATVQVMASTSGANFYGDIRGHDRVPLPFHTFLDLAAGRGDHSEFEEGVQLYLAQAGIEDNGPLRSLKEDLAIPSFLHSSPVSAINLWMSVNGSRSSTHYDPFHNLLCVVSGCKEVKMWPPSAAPELYPLPVFGEASNHSGVDFASPDLTKFPRFHSAMETFQSVTLHAGDALFLPEGWYHQVDSEAVTIAVNLWWSSRVSLQLGSHMDAYLLRRLLVNLLDGEKDKIIEGFRSSKIVESSVTCSKTRLTNAELQVLRTLVTCVSERADERNDDAIARALLSLDPPSLQRTLLMMSTEYPGTLESLILHNLSPLACEILTRKFEEMDEASELDCPQVEFYAKLYSIFDDPSLAMAALVNGKEALAAMALERVLDGHLGLSSAQAHAPPL